MSGFPSPSTKGSGATHARCNRLAADGFLEELAIV